MKKKIVIGLSILLILLLLIPIKTNLKDGGSVVYRAVLYRVVKVHARNQAFDDGYRDGTIVTILGIEVYNDVNIEAYDNIK